MISSAEMRQKIEAHYKIHDNNCATANLVTLSEVFNIEVHSQVIDAAIGMHGAGKYGAQCGLVEGTLMFIGILGKHLKMDKSKISDVCHSYAGAFESTIGSLLCRKLRPEGFKSDQPPHLCTNLTIDAVLFNVKFVSENLYSDSLNS